MNEQRVWLGSLGLMVVAGVIGWQVFESTKTTLPNVKSIDVSTELKTFNASLAHKESLLTRVRSEDSLLLSLAKNGVASDPFHARSMATTAAPAAEETAPAASSELPSVVLAAVDGERPEVVLRIGEQVSELLSKDAVWQGWKIVAITDSGIDVEGFGRRARLPIPNRQS